MASLTFRLDHEQPKGRFSTKILLLDPCGVKKTSNVNSSYVGFKIFNTGESEPKKVSAGSDSSAIGKSPVAGFFLVDLKWTVPPFATR